MQICKKTFFYEEYVRYYIHLFSQPYLSKVYSEHFFFFYIFWTKSKILLILLLILLKAFCLLAGYLRKMFTKLIKLHNYAYLQK